MQRVVISGVGVVSAVGIGREAFTKSIRSGQSGIAEIQAIDMAQFRFKNGAEVKGFKAEEYLTPKNVSFMDRFAQFSVVAAQEAIAHAGIEWTPELREQTAVMTGSCIGGRSSEEAGYYELFHNGRTRVHPLTIAMGMCNAGASHICMEFGITGPTMTMSTACASSAHAIGQAFWMVRSGAVQMAVAGGSDAPLFLGNLRAWEAMRVVSPDTCRPFSANRSGMILGEGAAMLVMETLESALARGAQPIAEIVGCGMSADACHITQPSVEGPARAMRSAMRDGGLALEQIGYINAHGTATEANDRIETAALHSVFGGTAERVAVSSTKSMHGHTLGAAGAIEAVATIYALRDGILPPTANYTMPDPACELDLVTNEARTVQVEAALSNSFAFGGLNAVLAFRTLS